MPLCPQSVTLHTGVGDIKIELFVDPCPKSCHNFLALCASGYYNGCLFHRNIKVVMVFSIVICNNVGYCPNKNRIYIIVCTTAVRNHMYVCL